MSLEGKTNFFEAKNSSYNKANASNSLRKDDKSTTNTNDENKNTNTTGGFTFNTDF